MITIRQITRRALNKVPVLSPQIYITTKPIAGKISYIGLDGNLINGLQVFVTGGYNSDRTNKYSAHMLNEYYKRYSL